MSTKLTVTTWCSVILTVALVSLVHSRPSRRISSDSSDSSDSVSPNVTARRIGTGRHAHSIPVNRTHQLDPADFRGVTGRQARSAGFIPDNGMGGVATAMLIQQMMAQNAAHNSGSSNCSGDGARSGGMDMQAMMPMILAMQNQPVYRGGFSG
ncbi:hypothetical protein BV898_15944 [Hypsibius exemplaris]|uniref:Secreted protein n=1 Tax=Hypsibius exemplaris TaxID=2072580 RepID=A0A9X6NE37_HYPEX|nr:hypothetical protein BV898_15944 [Hypsibius exemplaris]